MGPTLMTDPNEPPERPDPPESPPAKPGARSRSGTGGGRDQQIGSVLEILGKLARDQRRLEGQFNRLVTMLREQERASKNEPEDAADPHAAAPWVWFSPPAPDEPEEGQQDFKEDPQVFVTNFVAWYNVTFIGVDGGRARAIPNCWEAHPGLAMEVASLAYSWRAANLGPEASIKEQQYWLHQWRPGFSDRLVRDWVHADCVDGQHQSAGARKRDNRFVVNQNPPAQSPPQPPPPSGFPPDPPVGGPSP